MTDGQSLGLDDIFAYLSKCPVCKAQLKFKEPDGLICPNGCYEYEN